MEMRNSFPKSPALVDSVCPQNTKKLACLNFTQAKHGGKTRYFSLFLTVLCNRTLEMFLFCICTSTSLNQMHEHEIWLLGKEGQ